MICALMKYVMLFTSFLSIQDTKRLTHIYIFTCMLKCVMSFRCEHTLECINWNENFGNRNESPQKHQATTLRYILYHACILPVCIFSLKIHLTKRGQLLQFYDVTLALEFSFSFQLGVFLMTFCHCI